MTPIQQQRQAEIIKALGIRPNSRPSLIVADLVRKLADYLRVYKLNGYVLGISGGVDSTTTGKLAQEACIAARAQGQNATFVAVRLPYGTQRDEADAQDALEFIKPDQTYTVDIKPAVDATMESLRAAGVLGAKSLAEIDFIKGNVKARERMIVQYAIAGLFNGVVLGTDHAAEALMGFFTKHGDGAADLTPLHGYTKDDVRTFAIIMGAADKMAHKPPTADLEDLNPGLLDEVAYGVSYDTITAFLRGGEVSEGDADIIIAQYDKTWHKRQGPYTFA